MICISIVQESRRLAPVDMLNASHQCDLLEIRLDCFAKDVNVEELLAVKPRPVIMTARRARNGGFWDDDDEENRLSLLRQCVLRKADYVEIELDVADRIRPLPPTKRVISYTNLTKTPENLPEVYAQAQSKNPDVIKLTTMARTPEEAWPLVQILARPTVPTVVVGLGKAGVMLSLLAAKFGAPWTYAALERGMESHQDQPTIDDLKSIYHYPDINRSTRFIGVTGFGGRERATVAALNAAFGYLQRPERCLPMGVGNARLFGKVMETLRLGGAVINAEHCQSILELATHVDPVVAVTQSADLLLPHEKGWLACDTHIAAIAGALEAALKARYPDKGLTGRMVLIVGANDTAKAIGRELKRRGCALIIASHDRDAAHAIARELGCRHVQFEALYSILHEILIVCDSEKDREAAQGRKVAVHPGYLRPGMTVLHVQPGLHKSSLIRAAEARDCGVVTPYQLWLDQVALQAERITRRAVPRHLLADAAPWLREDE
jgi:3-dehydroquinate dehydratase/shikimate dehydrogenase